MRMKKLLFAILCLLVLSPALSRAETTIHNFHDMSGSSQLTFPSGDKFGVTDLVTYTCSGTSDAKFNFLAVTDYKICIYLPNNGDQVVTTPIANLDSLSIHYIPTNIARTIKVYTSVNNVDWTPVTVKPNSGMNTVKLPASGNYYLKIANEASSNAFYIREIHYVTKPCVCLKVVSE